MPLDLTDKDIKQEVDDLIAKAVADAVQKYAGLEANRNEILSEKKALQQKLEGLAGVTPDEFNALKSFKDEAEQRKLVEKGEYEKALAEAEKRNRNTLDQMQAALEARDKHIKETTLQRALLSANVKEAPLLEAAEALFLPQVQLADVEGQTVAQIDGKPVSEYVTAWAETDKGRFFVTAPTNKGGGTAPGTHAPGNGQLYRNEMTSADKARYLKDNPDKTLDDIPLSRAQ